MPVDRGHRIPAEAPKLPTLEGERIRLRWLESGDVPALFEVFGHPEVMRYWSRAPLRDLDDAAGLLAEIRALFGARTLFQWGLARASDDRVIGTCTLHHLEWAHGRAEVGYALGRAWWGQGWMLDALGRLVRYAFEELDLRRLEADCDPRNDRSLRLLERLGFRREGHLRERFVAGSEVQDSILLGLLRREWPRPTASSGAP